MKKFLIGSMFFVLSLGIVTGVSYFFTGCSHKKTYTHEPVKSKKKKDDKNKSTAHHIIESVIPDAVLEMDPGDIAEGISDLYLPEPVGDVIDSTVDGIYNKTIGETLWECFGGSPKNDKPKKEVNPLLPPMKD